LRKIYVYIIILIVILAAGFYFGKTLEAGLGALLVFLGIKKSNKTKREEAQKNIDEAGDKYEGEKHDADSALEFFDDFYDDDKPEN